jgi:hypothetical protein
VRRKPEVGEAPSEPGFPGSPTPYLPPDFGRRRSKIEDEHEHEDDGEQDRGLDKVPGIFPFTRRVI